MDYVQEAIQNQEKLVSELGTPYFAPADGICWKCHQQIYGTGTNQITKERAAKEFITCCPHCHQTYCDWWQ